MFSGAESPETIHAYRQELDRQIDRAAREREVQQLLLATGPGHEAGSRRSPLRGVFAAIAGKFRPARRMEQLPGN